MMYSAYKLNIPHSFIELHKAVVHVISMISFLWLDSNRNQIEWVEKWKGGEEVGKMSMIFKKKILIGC